MTDTAETTEATTTETPPPEPESISDLFNDDAAASTETETTETEGKAASDKGDTETTTESGAGTETKADKAGTEAGTEETDADSAPETPSGEDQSVPRQALLDERRKRQEAEERLRQLEPADEEAPDPTDDPEGHERYLRAKWEREQWQERATKSRDRMLEKQPDYEEKEKHFLYLASQDPELIKQMNEDPDPAAFAYNKAKESLDAQEQAIEERVVERLKKEGRLKESEQSADTETETEADNTAEAASRVSDLTSATGAGKNTGEEPVKESVNPGDVFDDLKY